MLEVNGEIIVERTIRLLKENGITDIAISTNNPAFDYLDVEKLVHINEYSYTDSDRNKKSYKSWLNAYYPMQVPCCYLHGDVYFTEEAIKKIINTKVKSTMFFCIPDLVDGRQPGVNPKGREPLAYKVQDQVVFRKAINDLLQMIDDGKFKEGIEPISWHLYRKLNNLDLMCNAKGYNANNIFYTKGDYVCIYDYTTDIDCIEDIEKIEKFIKLVEGGEKMIKAVVIEDFHLGKFNELKNLERANVAKNTIGYLYSGDTFECTEEMANYLTVANATGRAFIKVIEIIPEKKEEKTETKNEKSIQKEETKKEEKTEKPRATTRRRKTVVRK